MSEDSNRIVPNKELLLSKILEIQAIIRLLEKKGITTEGVKLKEEMEEKIKKE